MAFALSSPAFKKEIYGVKRADAEPSARRGGSVFSGAHAVVSEVGTGTRDGPHEDTGTGLSGTQARAAGWTGPSATPLPCLVAVQPEHGSDDFLWP